MEKNINKENWKDISTEELEKRIEHWRNQMINDINQNFAGKGYTNSIIATAVIEGLVRDNQILMQWCEILAYKIKRLENINKLKY